MGLTEVPLLAHDRHLLTTLPQGSRITRYDDGTTFGRVLINKAGGPALWMIMRENGCSLEVDVVDLDGETQAVVMVR